jgi:thiol-disulfide isomerase/thioredoxin
MTARLAVSSVYCALALAIGLAQTPEPAIPPDVKAYREATQETDPEKKIAAIENWKAQYPESSMRSAADMAMLSTLLTKLPGQQDRIRKFAAGIYKSAPDKEKGQLASQIATELLNANLLLKDAESYARKSVAAMSLSKYLQEQTAAAAKRGSEPPAPEALKKRFDGSRAARVAVLGRIEIRLGHTEKGRKLLEESNAGDGTNAVVQAELGILAVKAGDDRKALDYLIPAKLAGRANKEANEAFETAYKKEHNGSIEGAAAMLDAEYNRRFPNPVKAQPYQPAEKRSDRVVLAEVFTGSGCGPCAGADLAFDAVMERYSRKDVAVLMVHEHVPRPDPMTTAQNQALYKSYAISGVPTFFIDGNKSIGGGTREMAKSVYDRITPMVEKDLNVPAEAHITAGATLKGKTVDVNARVFGVTSVSKDLKVEIALIEKELTYSGENGIRFHPMVVRSIKSFDFDGQGYRHSFDLDEVSKTVKDNLDEYESKGHRGEPFHFTEKKYQIDANHLAVVIFVHDGKTKHVLQAGYIDLATDAPHPPTQEANVAR